jgi:hypothetical protein
MKSVWPLIQWAQGALCLGLKRHGRVSDHTLPTSAEVKKAWTYTATPHTLSLRSAYLVKHKDTFTVWHKDTSPCGGRLQFLHSSPASPRRRRTGTHSPVTNGHNYQYLLFQVGSWLLGWQLFSIKDHWCEMQRHENWIKSGGEGSSEEDFRSKSYVYHWRLW